MKKLLSAVTLFCTLLILAQSKTNLSHGIIITVLNDSIAFKDLTWDKNNKANFLNNQNNIMENLYDNSIKEILDVETNDPLYLRISGLINPLPSKPISREKIEYKNGIYTTKQDFINNKPTENIPLKKVTLYGIEKKEVDDEVPDCFFLKKDGKKLKNVFAVVYNDNLYFNIAAILSNRNKTDRAQGSDFPNSFVKVSIAGGNYLYMEAILANNWEKGLGYGLGGVAGSVIATGSNHEKGIVWDYKNQEFNIFKNCADYNEFIKELSPDSVQVCTKNQPDLIQIRNAIKAIK